MRLEIDSHHPWEIEADVLAIPLPATPQLPEAVAAIDHRLDGALSRLRELGAAKGKPWESWLLPATGMAAGFVLAVGVGDGDAFDPVQARRFGAVVLRGLAGCHVRSLAVYLPDELVGSDRTERGRVVELTVRGLVEGAGEPSTIHRQLEDDVPPSLDACVVAVDGGDRAELAIRAERGRLIGEGGDRTRRLAQRAANDVSPEVLADEASDIARELDMELTVLGPEEAAELGMGMFTAVGRGSDNPPRFIALRNQAARELEPDGRLLALVGKGVTFDTGGISLKSAAGMGEMKTDKTGACTVIQAIATVARLAPQVPALAVAPAVENMPGPHSTRPGDVVRALNGKTVEITNTDAEGRLILGDALTWAEQQGATHLVDVATLTGSMARALGRYVTGGFGSDELLWEEVAAAAARQGEPLWRMPLVEDLRKDLESPFADMANLGPAEGSSIIAALFLREFVTRPWVHLDIAGTAFMRKADPFAAKGATGVMHATLVELLAGETEPAP